MAKKPLQFPRKPRVPPVLSAGELRMAKELCVQLGECEATYYIVMLLQEVEANRKAKESSNG